jgi:hypothetical protein
MPRDARFGWQDNKSSRIVSYGNSYANSSFMKKRSGGNSSFGSSKRVWFTPKKTPCPAQYDIGTGFKRTRNSVMLDIPASGPEPRNMTIYKS